MQQVDVCKKSRECKCFQQWTKLSPTDETCEAVIKVSSPIQINHQPDATIFQSIILTFIYITGPTTNTARPSPRYEVNPLNPELNPICYLLALLAHHFLHVSRI